jgi:hypothetical protein
MGCEGIVYFALVKCDGPRRWRKGINRLMLPRSGRQTAETYSEFRRSYQVRFFASVNAVCYFERSDTDNELHLQHRLLSALMSIWLLLS